MVHETRLNSTVVYGVKVNALYGDCKADCSCPETVDARKRKVSGGWWRAVAAIAIGETK